MIDEDLDCFLADHGVPCIVAGVTIAGILNQADDVMQMDVGNVQSNMRDLTLKTSDVTALAIKAKTVIAVNALNYEVRSLDQPDDAAFTVCKVRKL
jgi:hypothetical protein